MRWVSVVADDVTATFDVVRVAEDVRVDGVVGVYGSTADGSGD